MGGDCSNPIKLMEKEVNQEEEASIRGEHDGWLSPVQGTKI